MALLRKWPGPTKNLDPPRRHIPGVHPLRTITIRITKDAKENTITILFLEPKWLENGYALKEARLVKSARTPNCLRWNVETAQFLVSLAKAETDATRGANCRISLSAVSKRKKKFGGV